MAEDIMSTVSFDDQRQHARLETTGIPWLRSARIKYGPHVQVLDLSATGILFQADQPLTANGTAVIELVGPMGTLRGAATVRRCRLVLCGEIKRYEIACVFKQRLQLPR
jgi:hypothetical protein